MTDLTPRLRASALTNSLNWAPSLVGGAVIYGKTQDGGGSVASQGRAIKFDRLTVANLQVLSELVAHLLMADIVTEHTEPLINPV